MGNYFTTKGLERHHRQIAKQEAVVRSVGQEVGEEAGSNCDWHDNFGYEDAKRRLELETKRLADLFKEAKDAQILSIQDQNKKVAIGSTVQIALGDDEKEFVIGAFGEADPARGLISYTAPLAQHLMGMVVGDTKQIHLGGRELELEVVNIKPPSHRYLALLEKFEEVSGDGS